MVVDYYMYDYENAQPPRGTSLQGTMPIWTFTDFGEDVYFVADERGYESLVHDLAKQFLKTDKTGSVIDARLRPNKVVRYINQSRNSVIVTTEDGSHFEADFVMVSVSIGVLQTDLIKFHPELPFWPDRNKTEFFLYASERRGYYSLWQELDREFPGANILLTIVSDEEARRIELQPDAATKAEAMQVLKNMFGKDIPEATDILVTRWSSNRFYMGAFSNWPVGVSSYEYNQIKAPFGRIYFTGEHTSELYNGYAHGAYLAGIDSAKEMIDRIKKGSHNIQIMS